MSHSREDSPDWLRAFEAPKHSVLMLSSDSEDSLKNSPLNGDTAVEKDAVLDEPTLVESDEDQKKVSSMLSAKSEYTKLVNNKTPRKRSKVEGTSTSTKRRKTGKEDTAKIEEESSEKEVDRSKASIWNLSSDSEPDATYGSGADKPHASSVTERVIEHGMELSDDKDSVPKVAPDGKSPTKKKKKINADQTPTDEKKIEIKGDLADVHEVERASEKHVQSCVTSSMLPLVIPEKVQRSKVLVECEGRSIDLSGDVGAVGRVIVSGNPSGDREMLLDLKGTIYRTTIVPSMTFCVVNVGPSEAKIEAIMNDFIQLKPQSNVYDAETMVEGSLDGFLSGSEDEADKVPKGGDKNEDGEEDTKEKSKAKTKSVRKSGVAQKKGKATSGTQVKKRKPLASKKGKAKK